MQNYAQGELLPDEVTAAPAPEGTPQGWKGLDRPQRPGLLGREERQERATLLQAAAEREAAAN